MRDNQRQLIVERAYSAKVPPKISYCCPECGSTKEPYFGPPDKPGVLWRGTAQCKDCDFMCAGSSFRKPSKPIKEAEDKTKDTHGEKGKEWIGVDLDGTLAKYNGWKGAEHIGEPIKKMLGRVKQWLVDGKTIKIVTARVAPGKSDAATCRKAIQKWCKEHLGQELEITHQKDHFMTELWDDRAKQIEPNTGDMIAFSSVKKFLKALTKKIDPGKGNHVLFWKEDGDHLVLCVKHGQRWQEFYLDDEVFEDVPGSVSFVDTSLKDSAQ